MASEEPKQGPAIDGDANKARGDGSPDRLEPGEYITDQAIESADDDRFGHHDIVGQLAELALRGPGKTNIALFAPWGTGKSGIAKLLNREIGGRARFAYFDAFKHRQTPLRRAFLRAVANGVGKTAESTDQYFKEKSRRVFDRASLRTLLPFVGIALLIGIALLAACAAGLAFLKTPGRGQDYGDVFVNILVNLGGVAGFLAATIGVIAAAASEGFGYTETSTPPSEDDQFEDGFKALISGKGRVVVFIDELDRCSADEVVETLETLRVFLDVEDCVFVVAADRRALEQALRNRARQETPFDESHPYFSSGSSYIDKIFQTQVSLPGVRARDMTEFAQSLVGEAPGTWATLREWGEIDDVIAALIPTHVRAPRQVKVLLNAYLIAHRIAAKRVGNDEMKTIKGRAAGLAQLVCLRIEFPLFAEDLGEFPELCRAIRARSAEPAEDLSNEIPRTWTRAGEYLSLRAPLAPLIVEPRGQPLPTPRDPDSGTTDPESIATDRQPPEPQDPDADSTEATRIALRRLDNLRSYLNRVRSLPQVERDLVYLHSAGTTETALEPSTADRLDTAARDGNEGVLDEILSGIPRDRYPDVITVLVGALDDAKVPVDSANATRVLLSAIRHMPDLEMEAADRAARAVGHATGDGQLETELQSHAVDLAARCSVQHQNKLLSRVASSGSMSEEVRHALLGNAESLTAEHAFVIRAVDRSISALDAAPELANLPGPIATDLARKGTESYIARKPTYQPPTPVEGEEPAELDQEAERATRLAGFFDGLIDSQPEAALEVAICMLAVDEEPSADAALSRRERLAPIQDRRLAKAVLLAARRYRSGAAASHLQAVDESVVQPDDDPALDEIAASCLRDALKGEPEQHQDFQMLISNLVRLRGGRTGVASAATDKAIGELAGTPVSDQTETAARVRLAANVRLLVEEGYADRGHAGSVFVKDAAAALGAIGDPPQPGQDPAAISRDAAQLVGDWATDADRQALGNVVDAAVACPPVANPARVTAMLAAASELRRRDPSVTPPISVDDLVALIEAHTAEAAESVAVWADSFASDAASIWRVLDPFWGPSEIPRRVREATAGAAHRLGRAATAELVGQAIDHALHNTAETTHYNNWEAVGLQTASDAVINNLAGRISTETTPEEWSAILHVARQASEGHPKVQLKLGNKLLVPLARADFALAVRNLSLVGSENGPKVVEKLEEIASTDAQTELLANRVKDLDWSGSRLQRFLDRVFPRSSTSRDEDDGAT